MSIHTQRKEKLKHILSCASISIIIEVLDPHEYCFKHLKQNIGFYIFMLTLQKMKNTFQ